MRVIYVAGSFRASTHWGIQQNVRRAEAAGLAVARLGAMPLIPHKNTENFHGLLSDTFWLEGTAELLRRCDAMYVFDREDLKRSSGTRAEIEIARSGRILVFYELDHLKLWLETS